MYMAPTNCIIHSHLIFIFFFSVSSKKQSLTVFTLKSFRRPVKGKGTLPYVLINNRERIASSN